MEKIILRCGACEAHILPYGATLHQLWVPDRTGRKRDIVLGYESVKEYDRNDGYLGATVGRNANRIAGSRFMLGDLDVLLTANEGKNQLHSGPHGMHQKVWRYTQTAENAVTLSTVSPHGEDGWPGTLRVQLTYTLTPSSLKLHYEAVSDRDTIVNMTNHAYFNLAGQEGGAIGDHVLTLNAAHYTPCGEGTIPTGEVKRVEGTALDFRAGQPLGEVLSAEELSEYGGLDHNFCLDGSEAASVYCPRTGIRLAVETTLPGLQVYTAGFLTERKGKVGAVYGKNHGICLETQRWPDAVHRENFPSTAVKAGETWVEETIYHFSAE